MCDYSLHHVSSRPAKVADKLVSTELAKSSTRGFTAVGELGAKLVIHDSPPGMAVCLLPGTELAFDEEVQYDRAFKFLGKGRINHKVASFREVDVDDPYVHHDALEFPNGQVLKITQLVPGQTATVLQLPVSSHHHHDKGKFIARSCDSRLVLNRTKAGLMPSQGTVMLWEAVRNTAVDFSTGLVESFRRLTNPKQPASAVFADLDGEEIGTNFAAGIIPTTPTSPAAPKPERAAV